MVRFSFVFLVFLFVFDCHSQPFPSANITLLGHWYDPAVIAEPQHGIKYNGVFGWTNPADEREYAIIGSTAGTYFIEITNPLQPVMRDFVPGRRDSCVWREIHTYQNFCYIVSDDPNPNSFQIVDLLSLPDSVHVVHDSTNIISRCHTIFVDGNKLYGGIPKGPFGQSSLAVFSLQNPSNPLLLRRLEQDYAGMDGTHDMFVRNDTIYASMSNAGYFVFRYDSVLNKFFMLGSMTSYPFKGYNHSSSVSASGNVAVMCDEVPAGLHVKVVDVNDLTDISVFSTFQSNEGATPHNPYFVGDNWVVISYYQDGIQIYNVANPANPFRSGFFDTRPEIGSNNGYPGDPYQGCWGAYTRFPSGVIVASDMQNGLFVLDASAAFNNGIAGDKNKNGSIDSTEIAGDLNENGLIEGSEIAGDVNGNFAIDSNEIAGDSNGSFNINSGELAGDINSNNSIDSAEVLGDINGNGFIDGNEVYGDANGDGVVNQDDWILLSAKDIKSYGNEINIYPNPADEVFFVLVNEVKLQYKLFDCSGQLIQEGIINGKTSFYPETQTVISLKDYPPGVYYIKISDSYNIPLKIEKLVKTGKN